MAKWEALSEESEEKSKPPAAASSPRCTLRPCKKVCAIIVAVILIGGCGAALFFLKLYTKSALRSLIFPKSQYILPQYNDFMSKMGVKELKIGQGIQKYVERQQGLNEESEKVVSCYYNLPKLLNSTDLMPYQIDSCMCTHINLAFASIRNKAIYLEDVQIEAINQVVKWNKKGLKLLLSVGGAGENNGFSKMIIDHASRKVFIRSIKKILYDLKLHGIDLDWEFPVVHQTELGNTNGTREKQHFSQLLREIRAEYVREKRDYLLTVAVAAQQIIVDAAYDVDQLNDYTDFVNIMTYDYHFYSTKSPFTGLNSPLFSKGDDKYLLSTLNVNYTVNMYIDKGLDKSKIVVGIPTYGHSFKLVNADNAVIGSPSSGYGNLGLSGFTSYPEICTFIKNYTGQVTIVDDTDAQVPYLYKGYEWVSYDNTNSVALKAAYIKNKGVRGAMIYSLNSDDYKGVCNIDNKSSKYQKFPLTRNINEHLRPNVISQCYMRAQLK